MRSTKVRAALFLGYVAFLAAPASAAEIAVAAGDGAAEKLVEALISAQPGDTVAIGAGRIELTEGLSLDADDVIVKGAGPDQTILSLKGQTGSGEGLQIQRFKTDHLPQSAR